jgi:UDP:flavonoid glycosyltransferase YjiC (YdhE family)
MLLSILATDSRGIVQPLVAVGLALQRQGHRIRIVSHERFRSLAEDNGLEFASLPDPGRGGWGSPNVKQISAIAKLKFATRIGRELVGLAPKSTQGPPKPNRLWEGSWEGCQGSDAVIFAWTSLWGCVIAEKLDVPGICTGIYPLTRTTEFPNFGFYHFSRHWPFGGWFNGLTYDVMDRATWRFAQRAASPFRKKLGLPPLPARIADYRVIQEMPVLYGFSPLVLPRPKDWPAHHHITGYWSLPTSSQWQPSRELLDFLAEGPAPVCVGYGSMTGGDTSGLTDLVVGAVTRAGQRGLLLTGWGGLGKKQLPKGFFAIEEAPHDWLYPRIAAVVHHGGCSTTGASLSAGVPTVITPWGGGDQPFWAERVYKLGCGPRAPSKNRLTAEGLAPAIREAVTNPRYRNAVRDLGTRLRAEDGVNRAAELIQTYIGSSSADHVSVGRTSAPQR